MTRQVDIYDCHIKLANDKVLLYYKGAFDELVLAKIGNYLRNKFNDFPHAGRKLFAVFMELAENISLYSAETNLLETEADRNSGVGTLIIQETNESFRLSVANLIKTAVVEIIQKKCDEINQLDLAGLRSLKKRNREGQREEGQRGGNFGLVQVAIKAESSLKTEVRYINEDFSYFVLSTEIQKN